MARRLVRLLLTLIGTGVVIYLTRHWRYGSALSVCGATLVALWFGFDILFPKRRLWWRR